MLAKLLVAAPLMLSACSVSTDVAARGQGPEEVRFLSVTGEGRAIGTPDMATLTLSVISEGKTASAAMQANAAQANRVRDSLKGLGIEARDMQTSGLSLNPTYAQNAQGYTDTSKIVGYQAQNSLFIRIRDVSRVGEAIDKATTSGANNIGGLQFGFQDTNKLLEAARRTAVKDAEAQAKLLAEEAGVALGPVSNISSYSVAPQPVMMEARAMAFDASAAPPIEAGEGQLSVQVSITYSLGAMTR
jgi:hypothetical protein